MSTTFTASEQVPADVVYLADGNNVVFARDDDELDLWRIQPPMPGFALPLDSVFAKFSDLRRVDHLCDACDERPGEFCCSAHSAHMCHACYRRNHFVEVCVAGCAACEREGLDPKARVPR
jgi:hypothetical protein